MRYVTSFDNMPIAMEISDMLDIGLNPLQVISGVF